MAGKHARRRFPIWLWIGAGLLVGLAALLFMTLSIVTVTGAKLSRTQNHAQLQAQEIEKLRRENRLLSGELRHLKETSQTLNMIKEKVFQINERRARLVKWSALPERGGNWINRIDKYLASTPLSGHGRTFYLSAVDAGIEPRLMPAIAMIESGAGRANANSNNFFGRRAVRGWMAWSTKEAAINNQGAYIAKMWGRATNPYEMKGYATSPVWKAKVAREMARI